MTDTQSTTLSPMRWLDTLFNPVGTSSKLDFTRAWTLLFFIQVSVVVVIPFVAGVVGLVGGTGNALSRFALYASPVVFIVTTLSSYIIHTRRLRDASKPTWLAMLILVPLVAGIFSFVGGVSQQSAKYDALYQDRQLYLTDRPAYEAKEAEKAEEARQREEERAKEAAEAEAKRAEELAKREPCPADPDEENENEGSGGNWNNNGPSAEDPLPSQIEFILTPNLGAIQGRVIPLSALLAVWSLIYVARAPLPARYQHPSQGIKRLYFSLHGRIGERQFWFGLLGWALFVAIGVLITVLLGFIAGLAGDAVGDSVSRPLSLIVALAAVWMLHAILIKRLHDFGQPAWRVLIPFLSAIAIGVIMFAMMLLSGAFSMLHCGTPDWVNYTLIAFGLIYAVICLLHFSWMAFSDPDDHLNEYGEPPKALEA